MGSIILRHSIMVVAVGSESCDNAEHRTGDRARKCPISMSSHSFGLCLPMLRAGISFSRLDAVVELGALIDDLGVSR